MTDIYISIGSNIEREKNIQRAISLLAENFSNIECSSVYETNAIGFDGEDFYNLVVKICTQKSLDEMQEILKFIETKCGRKIGSPEKKFTSRTIDLDLLLFGNTVLHNKKTDIPRTDITRYAFVLLPLSELAPDLQHPEVNITFRKLWSDFSGETGSIQKIFYLPSL